MFCYTILHFRRFVYKKKTERGFTMNFVSGETIADISKKYVEVCYNKLGDDEKSMTDMYVSSCTGFSNYPELAEYVFDSSEIHYPDLYNCNEQFLHNKYLRKVVVNGKTYMMFVCWVTFVDICPCIPNFDFLEDVPCLAYYEFVDQTNANGTVGANMRADKMYGYEIEKKDYPEWVNIMKKSVILKLVPKGTRSLYNGNIKEC